VAPRDFELPSRDRNRRNPSVEMGGSSLQPISTVVAKNLREISSSYRQPAIENGAFEKRIREDGLY
jgi:hypothetical protein